MDSRSLRHFRIKRQNRSLIRFADEHMTQQTMYKVFYRYESGKPLAERVVMATSRLQAVRNVRSMLSQFDKVVVLPIVKVLS